MPEDRIRVAPNTVAYADRESHKLVVEFAIPGAPTETIDVKILEDSVHLTAPARDIEYVSALALGWPVKPDKAEATYAPHLRFDRQGNGVDIRPLAPSSRFRRRGDFLAVQPDVDPIGRNGYPFDNVQDEAFHLDGRHGEPSLGKRASVAQGRIKGASLKIERC